MDWHQADSPEQHVQFIPAEQGWLALFEDVQGTEVEIHAAPVIAWRLGAVDAQEDQGIAALARAVIGAGPWLEKTSHEQSNHFFALVREEQLDPEFLAELKAKARLSRAGIEQLADRHRIERAQGHASWRRQRRGDKNDKPGGGPVRLFSI